jgi:nucleotide-binding universal stress UspA family protein
MGPSERAAEQDGAGTKPAAGPTGATGHQDASPTGTAATAVPGTAAAGQPAPVIVVGVDGSPDSSAALKWAASEARLRNAELRIIHTWSVPALSYGTYLPATAFDDVARAAERSLTAQIAEVLGDDPDIGYVTEVSEGPPASALLEAAETALLVVVGSRGRGGFAGLLLGSVSAQVAHHAHCPVLIVRAPRS